MSFFWDWNRDGSIQDCFLQVLPTQSAWDLKATEHGFTLQSATLQPAAMVLRLFAGQVSAIMLDALRLAVPEHSGAMQVTLHHAHPQLSAAVEVRFQSVLPTDVQQQIKAFAESWQLEVVILRAPVLLSQPGLLVMDMDSTAIQMECIDEIAKLAGVGEKVAAITARAMNGELDFAMSLRERVATLAGASETILAKVLADIPLMPGLTELVDTLLAHNWRVMIASGGFTYFTEALQQQLQLTATFANQLEIIDGQLTGQVLGDIVDANRKAEVVQLQAEQYQIPASQTVAIGDGANDLPMLACAALGVAFHAKPLVQAQAKVAIRQGSLLQLLYALDRKDWRL